MSVVMDGDGQLLMGLESTQCFAMDACPVTAVDSFGPSSGSHQMDTSNFLYQTKCGDCQHCIKYIIVF